MKIFLIRHGESMQNTKENYEKRLPDNLVYLTEKGKKQAEMTGLFLKDYITKNNIDLSKATLWVSPFERTKQTAEIINKHLNVERVKYDYALIEQRYGLFSDKTIDLIKEQYPDEFAFYDNYYQNDSKFYPMLPQGEAPFDVAIRTRLFLETIFRDDSDVLFVVSHGTTIRTIIMNWFHYSPEWFAKEPNLPNCAVRLIESENKISTEKYIYDGKVKMLKK